MPCPFPGMDPYLEGPLWPDVQRALPCAIREQLATHLRPKYVARLAVRTVKDKTPEEDVGIMYPDVGVLRKQRRAPRPAEAEPSGGVAVLTERTTEIEIAAATLTIAAYPAITVKQITVEIRDTDLNGLVTAIEIISPVNKRGAGLTEYRRKRRRLRAAGVHLLELDLLRRGTRVVPGPRVPACDYLISLTRGKTSATDLWPVSLCDRLPVVPVPLRGDDPDLPLVLTAPLHELYDAAGYDLSIDYAGPPPPPELSPETAELVRQMTARPAS